MSKNESNFELNIKAEEERINNISDVIQKIDGYNELSNKLFRYDINKSIEYSNKAYEKARDHNYIFGIAESLKNKGLCAYWQSDYKNALLHLFKSLNIFQVTENKDKISSVLNAVGSVYYRLENYSESIDFFYKSLEISKELNDKHGQARSENNLGLIYDDLGEHEKALSFYFKSIETKTEINERDTQISTLNNIGNVYSSMKRFDKALEYLNMSLELAEELSLDHLKGIALTNKGEVYENLKEYERSLEYHLQALENIKKSGNKYVEIKILLSVANIHIILKHHQKAIETLQKAQKITNEIESVKMQFEIHKALSKVYKQKKNYKKALEHFEQYYEFEKSYIEESHKLKMKNLSIQYEIDKNQREMELYKHYNIEDEKTDEETKIIKMVEEQKNMIMKKLHRYRFPPEIISLCVIWYIKYKFSFRDLVDLMNERGVKVSHESVHLWVKKFSDNFKKLKDIEQQYYSLSWRIEETTIKIKGKEFYYYKAIDTNGQFLDFYLNNIKSPIDAEIFLKKSDMTPESTPEPLILNSEE